MARIAYVNGAYQRLDDAGISIQDRGFQFADGIYEVIVVIDGEPWDFEGHLSRWERSLQELEIAAPVGPAVLALILKRVLRVNRLTNALVYFQATRGPAPRDHIFPADPTASLVVTAKPFDLEAANRRAAKGVSVISTPDLRWKRVDIKSVSLLPNVLAKENARKGGAAEAWLLQDGEIVTEGASSNAWMIDADDRLVTHPTGHSILGGITRATVKSVAEALQLTVEERAFTLKEAINAKEAFLTSATSFVTPVVKIDEKNIGDGTPGPLATRLREAYINSSRGAEFIR